MITKSNQKLLLSISVTIIIGLLFFISFFSESNTKEKVYGCIDSMAMNYNSEANLDDSSCLYFGCVDKTAIN